jgi:hypothetical protein
MAVRLPIFLEKSLNIIIESGNVNYLVLIGFDGTLFSRCFCLFGNHTIGEYLLASIDPYSMEVIEKYIQILLPLFIILQNFQSKDSSICTVIPSLLITIHAALMRMI